jgi:hypothetical protein
MWLKNQSVQKLGGGWLERLGLNLWSTVQIGSIRAIKDPAIVKLLVSIKRERRSLLSAWEQYFLYSVARSQATRQGAIAEVGVFRGGSARMICEAKGDRTFYLFDTFEGLPEGTSADRGVHRKNQYACSLAEVQSYLAGFENLHYFPGIFPESSRGVPEQQYSLVHFDVDLYEGTKGCLEYFYPRMIPGGIMISHDFGLLAGVEKAFREFMADKPETLIDLPSTQCMVIKL